MAAMTIALKRTAWKDGVDLTAPLKGQLPEPYMKPWHAAHIMGVSESTVYDSAKRFDAAMRAGDVEAASREVPCIILGSTHSIPTEAFLKWWASAGLTSLRALARQEEEAAS